MRAFVAVASKLVSVLPYFGRFFPFLRCLWPGEALLPQCPFAPSGKPKMVIIPLVVVVVSESSHSENNHTRLNEGERFTGMSRRGTENVRVFVD